MKCKFCVFVPKGVDLKEGELCGTPNKKQIAMLVFFFVVAIVDKKFVVRPVDMSCVFRLFLHFLETHVLTQKCPHYLPKMSASIACTLAGYSGSESTQLLAGSWRAPHEVALQCIAGHCYYILSVLFGPSCSEHWLYKAENTQKSTSAVGLIQIFL